MYLCIDENLWKDAFSSCISLLVFSLISTRYKPLSANLPNPAMVDEILFRYLLSFPSKVGFSPPVNIDPYAKVEVHLSVES